MRWPRIKARRKPSPPQKPRMPPRSRMTQLRQGKQRPKTFLPFNWARKKSLLLQPRLKVGVDRIRFLVRQSLGLTWRHISCVHRCENNPRLIKQINKDKDRQVSCFSALIAEDLVVRRKGSIKRFRLFFFLIVGTIHTGSIAARTRLWIKCFRFFFFLIASTIHTGSIAARTRLWIYHSYVLSLL